MCEVQCSTTFSVADTTKPTIKATRASVEGAAPQATVYLW